MAPSSKVFNCELNTHEESVTEEIAIIAESRATGQETVASLETKMPASLVENRAILPRIVLPQDLVGKV